LQQNFESGDFVLNEEQMQKIDGLDKGDDGCFCHPITPWLGKTLFPDELEKLKADS